MAILILSGCQIKIFFLWNIWCWLFLVNYFLEPLRALLLDSYLTENYFIQNRIFATIWDIVEPNRGTSSEYNYLQTWTKYILLLVTISWGWGNKMFVLALLLFLQHKWARPELYHGLKGFRWENRYVVYCFLDFHLVEKVNVVENFPSPLVMRRRN